MIFQLRLVARTESEMIMEHKGNVKYGGRQSSTATVRGVRDLSDLDE